MSTVHIREATAPDAANVIALVEDLYSEPKFLLYERGESVPQTERYAQRIAEGSVSASEVWLVAETAGQLVGFCWARRGLARRNRHSLFLALGVRQAWSGRGVGRSLLRHMEQWGRARGIHRLELVVSTRNTRALSLYESFGFEREGTKRHSLFVDGEYLDELYMAKLLEPGAAIVA